MTQALAVSTLVAYILFVVFYSSIASPLRARLRNVGLVREMLEEDCLLCGSWWVSLALVPAWPLGVTDWESHAVAVFIGPLLLMVFKFLSYCVMHLDGTFHEVDVVDAIEDEDEEE